MILVQVVVEPLKKLQSGSKHLKQERERSLKDYEIECEECDETTYVASYEKPIFCPICGRRVEAEEVENA